MEEFAKKKESINTILDITFRISLNHQIYSNPT